MAGIVQTPFLRNELILGENLRRDCYKRRAAEELQEIRDRMQQVLSEYDVSQEAYSILDSKEKSKEEEKERQDEIRLSINEYKDVCKERNSALAALEFFFSSYCELEASHAEDVGEGDRIFQQVYHPDITLGFEEAYVKATSALHRMRYMNSQIVKLASDILRKKHKMEVQMRQRVNLPLDRNVLGVSGTDILFPGSMTVTTKGPHRLGIDAAHEEYERLLSEIENKVAINSRLKKYVLNQEEAVDVCQSIAKRLADDIAQMLGSFSASIKDVKLACDEVEKCSSLLKELQEKYEISASECYVNIDQNKDILARNNRNLRNLKKYERNVKEIEIDFSRLEQLSKLLDTMKSQLNEASLKKELTEEQLRARIIRLRSDYNDEIIHPRTSSRIRIRDENVEMKKGKKRKSGKKKNKKTNRSGTALSDVISTTTINDGVESILSDDTSINVGIVPSPVSMTNISETVQPDITELETELETPCSPLTETYDGFKPATPEKLKKRSRVKTAKSRTNTIAGMSLKRLDTPENESPPIITALQSHSSPTVVGSDPISKKRFTKPNDSQIGSDTCITRSNDKVRSAWRKNSGKRNKIT